MNIVHFLVAGPRRPGRNRWIFKNEHDTRRKSGSNNLEPKAIAQERRQFTMLELTILLLSLVLSDATYVEHQSRNQCDDGSAPLNEAGQPNWRCRIEACAPNGRVCWTDRLSTCLDTGRCSVAKDTCTSLFRCFELWFSCVGKWECTEPGTVGCYKGTCTAPSSSSLPTSADWSTSVDQFVMKSASICEGTV